MIETFVNVFLHLDKTLYLVIDQFGLWTYLILFLIIFCETGLVVTPFLPGDSLLFAVGAFSASGSLNLYWVLGLLSAAGIIGDTVNYMIGKYLGDHILNGPLSRFVKKEHIEKTHGFYEKYGGKTIIIARFVPIVRTFAPFVAGIGSMTYLKFISYNFIGGLLWVFSLVLAGYYFGNIPIVKNNFTYVIFAIIFISILPGVIEYLRHRLSKRPASK